MHHQLDDKMHEYCGVFGIYAPGEAVSKITYYGLFALQHRGQEACGIASKSVQSNRILSHTGKGLVTEAFTEDAINLLKGDIAIGHVQYSSGPAHQFNIAQPIIAQYSNGDIACAHNGQLTNGQRLSQKLKEQGSVFQTGCDAEVFVHLIAHYGKNSVEEGILQAMHELEGAYAFVILSGDALYAVRDPHGNRPLCIGKYKESYVVASESCALDTVGATFIRDIKPGEIVKIDAKGVQYFQFAEAKEKAHCVFEYVYFARPDSTIDGVNVNLSRRRMGANLAKEVGELPCDVVIPVPDSGNSAALGFAEAMHIPFTYGILKNRYAGRTFIQPTQEMRELMVNLKLNPIRDELEGKRVAVVDDSIVRGTTSKRLVQRLRERGAKEVHFLVACPPVTDPCYYGIDTAERERLLATHYDLEGMRQYIGADSLHFLSAEGLIDAVGGENIFCTACTDGCYKAGKPEEEEHHG